MQETQATSNWPVWFSNATLWTLATVEPNGSYCIQLNKFDVVEVVLTIYLSFFNLWIFISLAVKTRPSCWTILPLRNTHATLFCFKKIRVLCELLAICRSFKLLYIGLKQHLRPWGYPALFLGLRRTFLIWIHEITFKFAWLSFYSNIFLEQHFNRSKNV